MALPYGNAGQKPHFVLNLQCEKMRENDRKQHFNLQGDSGRIETGDNSH